MRIIETIPHPSITISIFQMNDKYIVKFEAGPMEQAFKFKSEDVGGLDGVKKKIDKEFIDEVFNRFMEMKKQLSKTLSN
ncbi:MAG: hypothetical protein IAF38_06935 [Bacteroidia bacterium]|nr:hypothetical protein [Bacteroidia bacterium]